MASRTAKIMGGMGKANTLTVKEPVVHSPKTNIPGVLVGYVSQEGSLINWWFGAICMMVIVGYEFNYQGYTSHLRAAQNFQRTQEFTPKQHYFQLLCFPPKELLWKGCSCANWISGNTH